MSVKRVGDRKELRAQATEVDLDFCLVASQSILSCRGRAASLKPERSLSMDCYDNSESRCHHPNSLNRLGVSDRYSCTYDTVVRWRQVSVHTRTGNRYRHARFDHVFRDCRNPYVRLGLFCMADVRVTLLTEHIISLRFIVGHFFKNNASRYSTGIPKAALA